MSNSLFVRVTLAWVFLVTYTIAIAADENGSDCPCQVPDRPSLWEKEALARWMVHSLDWGVLTTISSRLPGVKPFGNVYSFVDGQCSNSTGTPYFYGTYLDQSFQDIRENPSVSLTLSEASLPSVCGGKASKSCSITGSNLGDPENPVCARLTLTGTLEQVPFESEEYAMAQQAFFERHPQMEYWPQDHHWIIAKLEIADIWLINYFGGAKILPVDAYYGAKLEFGSVQD